MNAGIARRVLELFRQTTSPVPCNDSSLTPREMDILNALVDGGSYKMIAEREFISIETVRTHIRAIYQKLQVNTKTDAVLKYLGKG